MSTKRPGLSDVQKLTIDSLYTVDLMGVGTIARILSKDKDSYVNEKHIVAYLKEKGTYRCLQDARDALTKRPIKFLRTWTMLFLKNPKPEKLRPICIKVSPEIDKKIRSLAKRHKVTTSEVVRFALDNALLKKVI